jgi:hypothetical protein
MLSVGSKRLTDSLWLAAHDGLRSRPRIGEKPLGVGLATGLLAELIYDGCLELRDGELFRTDTSHCPDPAASGNAKILVSGQLSLGSRTPEFLVCGQVISVPTS